MTKPINEPYPEQDIARNKFAIKDTRQHVEATRWYVLDDGVITIDPQDLGPALVNGFVQLGSPDEHFAFRLSRDGSIQTKGMLNASGVSSGTVAWTMPGPADINVEPYLIPFADGNAATPLNQAFGLRVTTSGAVTDVTPATGYIDSTTGDVTLSWGSPAPGLDSVVVYDSTISGTATVANNTLKDIIFDNMSIAAGSTAFAPDQSLPTSRPVKAIKNGWYLGFLNFEWAGLSYPDVRTYSLYQNSLADNVGDVNIVQSASSPYINAAFNGSFGPLYIRGASLSASYFKVRVQHVSGVLETIAGVELTLVFLGVDLEPGRWPPF